jgi:hypothetical protein
VVVELGETASDPESASDPFQPPDAVHEVALVLDQVSVVLPPALMVEGLAVNRTVAAPAG